MHKKITYKASLDFPSALLYCPDIHGHVERSVRARLRRLSSSSSISEALRLRVPVLIAPDVSEL